MDAILLLMGLLVLSYLGSLLVGGRFVRGVGLPSAAEYIALGFLLGPQALGLVERSMLESFEPIAQVAVGWLALAIGLGFGFAGERRVRAGSAILGLLSAVLTTAAVGGGTWLLLQRVPIVPPGVDRWLLAGGTGAACATTTRVAVSWVVERHKAKGPLSDLFAEIAYTDDLVPLAGLAVLFALTPPEAKLPWHLTIQAWVGVTFGIGAVLGLVAVLLLGKEVHLDTAWGVLIGTSLLAIGTAARFRLSTLSVTFTMGVVIAALSRHRAALRDMIAPTERPVLLPALLLAGAHIELHPSRALGLFLAVVIGARVLGKLVTGVLMRIFARAARPAGMGVGLGLLSAGALSMAIGLSFALRFPGPLGDTVLVASGVVAVFGEFVAPASMRRVLARAGEIDEAPPSPKPAAAVERVHP
jgi:hypothetical protein